MASRTMKERHNREKRAKGGKTHLYNAVGSPEAEEATDEKEEFKKGGRSKHKDGGHTEGAEAKMRGDRKPRHKRAAGGHTPFSSGHETSEPKGVSSGKQGLRP